MDFLEKLEAARPDDEGLQAEVEFVEGVKVTVYFWSEDKLLRELKKCSKVAWDKRHQKKEIISDDRFKERLVKAVKGWDGLTARVLAEEGVIQLSKFKGKPDEPMPYDPVLCVGLMGMWPKFGDFVLDSVTDPKHFPLAEEKENLSDTSDGPASLGG